MFLRMFIDSIILCHITTVAKQRGLPYMSLGCAFVMYIGSFGLKKLFLLSVVFLSINPHLDWVRRNTMFLHMFIDSIILCHITTVAKWRGPPYMSQGCAIVMYVGSFGLKKLFLLSVGSLSINPHSDWVRRNTMFLCMFIDSIILCHKTTVAKWRGPPYMSQGCAIVMYVGSFGLKKLVLLSVVSPHPDWVWRNTVFLSMFIEGIILYHMTTIAYMRGPMFRINVGSIKNSFIGSQVSVNYSTTTPLNMEKVYVSTRVYWRHYTLLGWVFVIFVGYFGLINTFLSTDSLSNILLVDQVHKNFYVSVNVHRGHTSLPHDHCCLLERNPKNISQGWVLVINLGSLSLKNSFIFSRFFVKHSTRWSSTEKQPCFCGCSSRA